MRIWEYRSISEFNADHPTEQAVIEMLMREGLIKDARKCAKCGADMMLRRKGRSMQWRCRTSRRDDCSTVSVKKDSFFERSSLSLKKAVNLIILWISKFNGKQMCDELHISKTTASDWRNFCREKCIDIQANYGIIGGSGKVIEIDESCLHTRKYGRGLQRAKEQWIFAAIERNSGRCRATWVKDRKASTLVPILKKWCHRDSTIISDQWKAYSKLGKEFERHETLNHSIQFGRIAADGLNVNTNAVEGWWTRMKKQMKAGNGTSDALLHSYVAEAVVRQNERGDFAERIWNSMKNTI